MNAVNCFFLLSLLVTTFVAQAVSPADCLSESPPFVLADSCARGYYCPNYNASNPDSYPAQCDPTTDCSLDRLSTKFCAAQGTYEPVLCTPGYYCPDPLTMIECPDGYSCLRGQYEPLACSPLSYCPAGTSKKFEYGSVIAVIISDTFLAILWFLSKRHRASHAQSRANAARQLEVSAVNISLQAKGATYQQLPEQLKVLCHGFKRAQQQLPSMRLEFKDLSLTIPSQNGLPSKTILKGVTGQIEPAKVTAIMGPSGAGKTTFLNTLLGKVDDSWQRGGSLTINGRSENLSRFRSVIGYVPQEDIMQRELTVYDNIAYSANIRLPRSWTAKQREDHISSVIHAMQLGHVQDTRIGDELVRGVSGGQRKRCNIGMEVAAAPSLLLLDEPTSGLDSTSAMEICGVLKDLTRVSSLTVAMVIHQPRVEIWNQLDELLLLAPGGLTVYQGPQRLAVAYFKERLDVQLSPYENPADALMDRIADSADEFVQSWNQGGAAYVVTLKSREPEPAQPLALAPLTDERPPEVRIAFVTPSEHVELAPLDLSTARNASATNADTKPDSAAPSATVDIRPFPSGTLRLRSGFLTQVWQAFSRSIWKQLANSSNFIMENALSILAGFVIGALVVIRYQGILLPPYTLLSPSTLEGLLPLAFFYVGLSISLAAASAGVGVFADEQAVYRRECASGHSLLAYYFGVSLAQLPRLYFSALHFTLVFHLINQPLSGFGYWLIVAFLQYFSTYGLAAFMSMIASRKNSALLAVVICLIFSLMTGKSEIPEVIQYFSASRWASEAIFGVETKPFRHIMDVDRSAHDAGYELDRFGVDMVLMFVVGVFYRVITFGALRWAERKSVGK